MRNYFYSLLIALLIVPLVQTNVVKANEIEAANAKSFTVTTKIVKIRDVNLAPGHLQTNLFLQNGMIATIDNPSTKWKDELKNAKEGKNILNFVLEEKSFRVFSVRKASTEEIAIALAEERAPSMNTAPRMTLKSQLRKSLANQQEVDRVYWDMHPDFIGSPSQCFRRAHVWAYEFEQNLGLDSNKYFLMFGGKYVESPCNYHWWFHVTPYVYVNNSNGKIVPITMDRTEVDGPMSLNTWVREFVYSQNDSCYVPENVTCPVLEYNQYDVYDRDYYNEFCFVIRTNKYYYYPSDMEDVTNGEMAHKTHWVQSELDSAYSEKN